MAVFKVLKPFKVQAFFSYFGRPRRFTPSVGKSKIASVLGAQVRNEIVAVIGERAAALSLSKSRYLALILEDWFAKGAPAVTPADRAMQDLRAIQPPAITKARRLS